MRTFLFSTLAILLVTMASPLILLYTLHRIAVKVTEDIAENYKE